MYGFLELQSIQRYGQSQFEYEDYIKKYMHNSQSSVEKKKKKRTLRTWARQEQTFHHKGHTDDK